MVIRGGALSRTRISPGVAFVLAAILVAVLWLGYRVTRPSTSGPMNVAELEDLKQDAASHPQDADRAMDLLIGYSGLLGQFGDLERATKGTLATVDENPVFGAKPEIRRMRQKIVDEWDKYMAKVGINGEAHKAQLLGDALTHADSTLARADLSTSQRSAAHLARGRLWLQSGEPRKAITDANRGADPVMASLLRADAYTDMQNWTAAIKELRGASLALSAWANKDPGWEMKLWWSMRRGRGWRRERRWKERRGEIARNIRAVVADEIRVLQGLEKLDQMHGSAQPAS